MGVVRAASLAGWHLAMPGKNQDNVRPASQQGLGAGAEALGTPDAVGLLDGRVSDAAPGSSLLAEPNVPANLDTSWSQEEPVGAGHLPGAPGDETDLRQGWLPIGRCWGPGCWDAAWAFSLPFCRRGREGPCAEVTRLSHPAGGSGCPGVRSKATCSRSCTPEVTDRPPKSAAPRSSAEEGESDPPKVQCCRVGSTRKVPPGPSPHLQGL